MPDKFQPISLKHLLQLILNEYNNNKSIFGIPEEIFFNPQKNNHLATELFDQKLHTPVGVAAGPHTQMGQNIIAAWLMGACYIELKTVQTLDEIEVSKPCIDMQDEGYNCEWSQELKITESFNEYLNAWILIHILNHKFGRGKETGTIFNMSVGYNMKGILSDNIQWFLQKMSNCDSELDLKIAEIRELYPDVDEITIPSTLSNNITLSTMHGCPAEEIEEIAGYLLEKMNLHTFVKLNPTLLGKEMVRDMLNSQLNFKTIVPDIAFEHDLKYADAIRIIGSLQKKAKDKNLGFGIKLTNTLESVNNRDIFDSNIKMIYLSGRALHPLSVNLASRLQNEFNGDLLISFSAGADTFNISSLIKCGFKTVTVCSDILKPGGYMRFKQYFDTLLESFDESGSADSGDLIIKSSGMDTLKAAALSNLINYAEEVLESNLYKRSYLKIPDIKTKIALNYFDCISAPCRNTCATNQDIPDYMYLTSINKPAKAYKVILRTNPFPSMTGLVCDHLCQDKCTRVNYDDPLQIREVKRFISEQEGPKPDKTEKNGIRVAIIGAGPAGLSCAYYLSLAGFSTDIFEAGSEAGGMVKFAIPGFRLTDEAIEKDLKHITGTGVNINYNHRIDREKFQELRTNYEYIFVATGAPLSVDLNIEGTAAEGVIDPLNFLFKVKAGKEINLGRNIVIIGGGNTAMDAARTAWRLVERGGKVTIVYRRTINEMPADQGEIRAVLKEGVEIIELAAPEKLIVKNGHVTALICCKMALKDPDSDGRPAPVKISGSEFEISCDTLIPAIGQIPETDFAENALLSVDNGNYQTKIENVFIGGDALRGASTAINAIGDGRKAAQKIIDKSGIEFRLSLPVYQKNLTKKELMIKRSRRIPSAEFKELAPEERKNFNLISKTPDAQTIIEESSRCLYCDELCNICTTVCPNLANYSYEVSPVRYNLQKALNTGNGVAEIQSDKVFEVKQKYQILNIANFCNECGNCNSFCPTSGAPYKVKPRICLTILSFNKIIEGYYLSKIKERKNLIYRLNATIETLTELTGEWVYETDHVFARFSKDEFLLLEVKFKTPCVKQVRFEHAAAMSIIIRGADRLVFG
jgi:putative selenate reductase